MRPILLITSCALLLAACEEELTPDEQSRMPNDDQIRIVAQRSNETFEEVRDFYLQCVAEGGKGIIGGFGQAACEKTTGDAGKTCSKESDCEGFCLAETKSCAPKNPLFGCTEVLTDDGIPATICVD